MKRSTDSVTAFIEAARDLLKPEPVRRHHCPGWFKKHALRPGIRDIWACGYAWLDHWGSIRLPDGRVGFVSEPYQVTAEDIAECEAIAERAGCVFEVDSNSWWYPGRTIRLVFYPLRKVLP